MLTAIVDTYVAPAVDLRAYHVIRDQGTCGSCYCFSASSAMESRILQTTGQNLSLSKQQCVSCSGGNGCGGGVQTNVYKYAMLAGLVSDSDYPYTGTADKCSNTLSKLPIQAVLDNYTVNYDSVNGVNPNLIKA